jgi:hypothetical protein
MMTRWWWPQWCTSCGPGGSPFSGRHVQKGGGHHGTGGDWSCRNAGMRRTRAGAVRLREATAFPASIAEPAMFEAESLPRRTETRLFLISPGRAGCLRAAVPPAYIERGTRRRWALAVPAVTAMQGLTFSSSPCLLEMHTGHAARGVSQVSHLRPSGLSRVERQAHRSICTWGTTSMKGKDWI